MKALLAKQKMINKVILIPEYKIKPNPYQPRKVFDDEKIDQLGNQHCTVWSASANHSASDGGWKLSAGCRRKKIACLQKAAHAGSSSDFDQYG